MEYNKLINEFLDELDKNIDINNIKHLKTKLLNNLDFLSDINNYRLYKTVNSKIKLYENLDYIKYLEAETNINLLNLNIKNKFKIFKNRKCIK